ncbi:MAG: M28 family peptidase [Pirellulaceae bacterium]|nr:M28 family peptidase [Pirellulaceae bacterium]
MFTKLVFGGNAIWINVSVAVFSSFVSATSRAQDIPAKFEPNAAIESAAAKIDEGSLRGAIRFLADDLLEGRGPGTVSDEITQLYLSTQLESFGYQPAAGKGKWIQRVPMIGVTTQCPPTVSIRHGQNNLELKFFDDFIGNGGRPQESISIDDAELVFVGYGIQAPEFQWDDFKGKDLRGKILVMMNNDPEIDPKIFAGRRRLYYGRWSYKYEMAAKHGAAGAIIIHTTPSAGYPFTVVQTSWTGEEFELEDTVSPRLSMKAWVTEDAARRLFSQAGFELDVLRSQAEGRDFQPVSLGSHLSIDLKSQVRTKETGNVLGVIEGSDPKLKNEFIVLMAHHDHLGLAESRDQNGDNIYNGAIDNASGTATLLCLAKAFASLSERPRRSILVAAVGAEEQGLLGSAYLAAHPPVPPEKMAALINIDGLNHLGPSRDVHVIGAGKSSLDLLIASVAQYQGRLVTPDLFPDRGSYYRSDQFSLAKIGVPGVYLQSGTNIRDQPPGWGKEQLDRWIETHYHQRNDEYDTKWDLRGAVEDAKLLFYVAWLAGDAPTMQTWQPGDEFEQYRKKESQ